MWNRKLHDKVNEALCKTATARELANIALTRVSDLEKENKKLRELLASFGIEEKFTLNITDFGPWGTMVKENSKINPPPPPPPPERIRKLAAAVGLVWQKGETTPDGFVKSNKAK
jgi:hypothetical protein